MNRKTFLFAVLVVFSFISIFPPSVWAQGVRTAGRLAESGGTFPQPDNNYLNDLAKLMDVGDAAYLKSHLEQVESQTGIEICVVTIKNMSSFGMDDIEGLARKFFNTWGVGNTKRNDGILVLVAHENRKMAIEVGDGWGSSLKSKLQSIIMGEYAPHFKADRYSVGIKEGTDALIKLVTRPQEWYERKWVKIALLSVLLVFLGAMSYSCFKDGQSGWGWVFLIAAITVLGVIIKILLTPKRGSSSSFGGGFSSGGGGASGSW